MKRVNRSILLYGLNIFIVILFMIISYNTFNRSEFSKNTVINEKIIYKSNNLNFDNQLLSGTIKIVNKSDNVDGLRFYLDGVNDKIMENIKIEVNNEILPCPNRNYKNGIIELELSDFYDCDFDEITINVYSDNSFINSDELKLRYNIY